VCQADVGFPNVRATQQLNERKALANRVREGRKAAIARGAYAECRKLYRYVVSAPTFFNRRLPALGAWVSGPSPFFFGFHHEQTHGMRPALDKWERTRIAVESTVNPGCYQHLNTAAISGLGLGLRHYGDYKITLNEKTISHRASIFEKNPFIFCADLALKVGDESPPGYRAGYWSRGSLAVAKLGDHLRPGMIDAEIAALVLDDALGHRQDCDFIEAHIFGPIHRDSIVRVQGPRPTSPSDQAIWEDIKERLTARGVVVEEHA
jgi:hypothetical protein